MLHVRSVLCTWMYWKHQKKRSGLRERWTCSAVLTEAFFESLVLILLGAVEYLTGGGFLFLFLFAACFRRRGMSDEMWVKSQNHSGTAWEELDKPQNERSTTEEKGKTLLERDLYAQIRVQGSTTSGIPFHQKTLIKSIQGSTFFARRVSIQFTRVRCMWIPSSFPENV